MSVQDKNDASNGFVNPLASSSSFNSSSTNTTNQKSSFSSTKKTTTNRKVLILPDDVNMEISIPLEAKNHTPIHDYEIIQTDTGHKNKINKNKLPTFSASLRKKSQERGYLTNNFLIQDVLPNQNMQQQSSPTAYTNSVNSTTSTSPITPKIPTTSLPKKSVMFNIDSHDTNDFLRDSIKNLSNTDLRSSVSFANPMISSDNRMNKTSPGVSKNEINFRKSISPKAKGVENSWEALRKSVKFSRNSTHPGVIATSSASISSNESLQGGGGYNYSSPTMGTTTKVEKVQTFDACIQTIEFKTYATASSQTTEQGRSIDLSAIEEMEADNNRRLEAIGVQTVLDAYDKLLIEKKRITVLLKELKEAEQKAADANARERKDLEEMQNRLQEDRVLLEKFHGNRMKELLGVALGIQDAVEAASTVDISFSTVSSPLGSPISKHSPMSSNGAESTKKIRFSVDAKSRGSDIERTNMEHGKSERNSLASSIFASGF